MAGLWEWWLHKRAAEDHSGWRWNLEGPCIAIPVSACLAMVVQSNLVGVGYVCHSACDAIAGCEFGWMEMVGYQHSLSYLVWLVSEGLVW